MSFAEGGPVLTILWLSAWVAALLMSTSAAILFWITYYREHKLRAAWRAAGFLGLAMSFALKIFSIWLPQVLFAALILEPFAFFAIYRGVYYEPILTHLRAVATSKERQKRKKSSSRLTTRRIRLHLLWVLVIASLLLLSSLLNPITFSAASYLLAALFIGMTIRLQTKRFLWERDSRSVRLQNFYPLVGYICLFLYSTLSAPAYLAPAYQFIPPATLLAGMVLLFLWAWIFIQVRNMLRRSVMLLSFFTVGTSLALFSLTYFVTRLIRWLVSYH